MNLTTLLQNYERHLGQPLTSLDFHKQQLVWQAGILTLSDLMWQVQALKAMGKPFKESYLNWIDCSPLLLQKELNLTKVLMSGEMLMESWLQVSPYIMIQSLLKKKLNEQSLSWRKKLEESEKIFWSEEMFFELLMVRGNLLEDLSQKYSWMLDEAMSPKLEKLSVGIRTWYSIIFPTQALDFLLAQDMVGLQNYLAKLPDLTDSQTQFLMKLQECNQTEGWFFSKS